MGGAASPWLNAGRVHWRLKGECRAGTRNETRGWGPVARTACMPLGRLGVRRRVWAMCSCGGRVCVGMARGCREAKNARRARAVAAVEAASPRA